jgi:addiction module HigA family antidote
MTNSIRKPTHPGAFFKSVVLDERKITTKEAAASLNISINTLNEFISGESKCSFIMAQCLSVFTGTDTEVWMNMQAKLDAWEAEHAKASS